MSSKYTDEQEEMFAYLEQLRQLGVTNMKGATPYLQEHFEIPYDEAEKTLLLWIEFKEESK